MSAVRIPSPVRHPNAVALSALLAILALPAALSAQSAAAPAPDAPRSASAGLERMAGFTLTAVQRTTIDSLARHARATRDSVLGPVAREARASAPSVARDAQRLQPGAPVVTTLALSGAQREAMQQIGADYESALLRVLTPAQQRQLTEAREALYRKHRAGAEAAAQAAYANRPTQSPAGSDTTVTPLPLAPAPVPAVVPAVVPAAGAPAPSPSLR